MLHQYLNKYRIDKESNEKATHLSYGSFSGKFILDKQQAKKMIKSNNVTPEQEHQLRFIFDPIKVKINGYDHTDNIEASSYIVPSN